MLIPIIQVKMMPKSLLITYNFFSSFFVFGGIHSAAEVKQLFIY